MSPQSPMLDLTDFLVNGIRDNGVTNTVVETGSPEQFGLGRQITLGLRLTF